VEGVLRWPPSMTRSVWLTATHGGVAPVIGYEQGRAREVHNAPELLEEVRGGQEDHRSRWIDDEPPLRHCSPWWGKA
jgi:hypothetical protein